MYILISKHTQSVKSSQSFASGTAAKNKENWSRCFTLQGHTVDKDSTVDVIAAIFFTLHVMFHVVIVSYCYLLSTFSTVCLCIICCYIFILYILYLFGSRSHYGCNGLGLVTQGPHCICFSGQYYYDMVLSCIYIYKYGMISFINLYTCTCYIAF